jgi:MoaE-MoaD fusion protein
VLENSPKHDKLDTGYSDGPPRMRVQILFFGMLKDVIGHSAETLDLPDDGSVADVLRHLEVQAPRLKESLASLAVAVNQEYAGPETELKENDEVALLPPVSGGSPEAGGDRGADLKIGCRARITRGVIDTECVLASLKSAEDGAALVFEGVVRNHTRRRKTLYLEYEAYEEMALREMELLAGKALREFHIRDVALVHRLGRLEIGETSVLIAVASAHRSAAFEACRWLIDTLKRTVPIWKKEYFEDGSAWADGEPFPAPLGLGNSCAEGSPTRRTASK